MNLVLVDQPFSLIFSRHCFQNNKQIMKKKSYNLYYVK